MKEASVFLSAKTWKFIQNRCSGFCCTHFGQNRNWRVPGSFNPPRAQTCTKNSRMRGTCLHGFRCGTAKVHKASVEGSSTGWGESVWWTCTQPAFMLTARTHTLFSCQIEYENDKCHFLPGAIWISHSCKKMRFKWDGRTLVLETEKDPCTFMSENAKRCMKIPQNWKKKRCRRRLFAHTDGRNVVRLMGSVVSDTGFWTSWRPSPHT